jgi:hypothetical protein
VDFDTSGSYFSVSSSGTITVLVSGYYRINAWAICNSDVSGGGYAQIRLVVNGAGKHCGYQYCYQGKWFETSMDVILPMNDGDTFHVEYYNPGSAGVGYAYHCWTPSGQFSRLQVSYEGSL